MRPAVHASILRNRSQRSRRVARPHTFSMRRLLMLAFVGALFFIPGIVLTIVGLEKTAEEYEEMENGQKIVCLEETSPSLTSTENGRNNTSYICFPTEIQNDGRMYQAIGPAFTTLGVAFLFSSCVYYYCYGTGESNRMPGGSHQGSISSDPNPHHHHSQHHHSQHGHHFRRGSQLNTPDGSMRRLSFKDDQVDNADPTVQAEEQMPLAPPTYDLLHSPPLVAIRVDRAPDVAYEDDAQEREHLVNGEVTSRDPSPA